MTIIEAIESEKAFKRIADQHWFFISQYTDQIVYLIDDEMEHFLTDRDILADDWIVREE